MCAGSEAYASAAAISESPSGGLFGGAGEAVPGATYHKARTKHYADTILPFPLLVCLRPLMSSEAKQSAPDAVGCRKTAYCADKLSHKPDSSISITQSSGWCNTMTRRSSSPEQPGVRFRAAGPTSAAATAASALRRESAERASPDIDVIRLRRNPPHL